MSGSNKISVAILGATGSVGQKFIELLENHPWFEIKELTASEKSAGKKYKEATNWMMSTQLKDEIKNITVKETKPNLESKLVFSAMDSSVAGPIEEEFAKNGYIVVSNAKNHRMDSDVPLMIPEVNPDHIDLIKSQKYGKGAILTNPNCSTIGLVLALKPLYDAFGLKSLNVVTMQAFSGGGYPGIPSMDIMDNVIPYISGEEDKIENEPLKIFGNYKGSEIENAKMDVFAQCNRVPVIDGHLESVQVNFEKENISLEKVKEAFNKFTSLPQELKLPTAPKKPIYVFEDDFYPQPRLQRNLENGMAVSVGRLKESKLFDCSFVVLSHNTVRGAAGGTILTAELLKSKGYLDEVL